MKYDFLKDFDIRMKKIGYFVLLCKNTISKTSWTNYGFTNQLDSLNLIFSVLLFIMEQSLKEEICTIYDISLFLDDIMSNNFKKPISNDECIELSDFIVNTILCNNGEAMYINGFDYENSIYNEINIRYVSNKIEEVNEQRRTSYYLTDDGYNLLLSTLEIDNNMRLTIHEMIFKLHLEKASYDKAVDEVKTIFNLIRMQIQNINNAIDKIKNNPLSYTIEEYKNILNNNFNSLSDTREKFGQYKELVQLRIDEIQENNIELSDFEELDSKELDNLNSLKTINTYLSQSMEEQQKLLNHHFDFKNIYSTELEEMAKMVLIKRININTEIYDKILNDVTNLEDMNLFFSPLFKPKLNKYYNINKSIQYQKAIKNLNNEEDEIIVIDDEEFNRKKEEELKRKILNYEKCVETIINIVVEHREITLSQIREELTNNKEKLNDLIPTIEVFREVIIEFLKSKIINVKELIDEMESIVSFNKSSDFQLNEIILKIIEENKYLSKIKYIKVNKCEDLEKVSFNELKSENGFVKTVLCSDLKFIIE
ncbi:MAG: hypothetical protein PHT02_04515 [Tissierellia bacterium]|nr:hypothetical protein [Tissierellia bacterium]